LQPTQTNHFISLRWLPQHKAFLLKIQAFTGLWFFQENTQQRAYFYPLYFAPFLLKTTFTSDKIQSIKGTNNLS